MGMAAPPGQAYPNGQGIGSFMPVELHANPGKHRVASRDPDSNSEHGAEVQFQLFLHGSTGKTLSCVNITTAGIPLNTHLRDKNDPADTADRILRAQ